MNSSFQEKKRLRHIPIGFAHRGARAHAQENTKDAFLLALRLGATGIESDVWITADNHVVMDHDGSIRTGFRRRKISQLPLNALPSHIPSLIEFFSICDPSIDISLDIKDPKAASQVLAIAQQQEREKNVWLCHHDVFLLTQWREISASVRLVHSTWIRKMNEGPEKHAARLAAAHIDAVNLHYREYTGGLIALFHRFGLYAFAWDLQFSEKMKPLLKCGIDAIYSDFVNIMMDVIKNTETSKGFQND